MSFADTFKATLDATPRSGLRRSLLRAVLGLVGVAAVPLLAGASGFAAQSLRVLAALGIACALAFAALRWLATQERKARQAAPLRVLARTTLSPKNGLALVEADGRRFLLAYGDGFTQLLSSAPLLRDAEAGGEP